MDLCERVWNEFEDRFGSDLRVVIRYQPSGYDMEMRDDVRAEYTRSEVRAIVDDIIVDQLKMDQTVGGTNTGDLHGLVRIYDVAWVLIWPDGLDSKSGFVVSFQRDSPSVGMDAVDAVTRYLNDEIEPQIA